MALDPLCGTEVNPAGAKQKAERQGKTSYFCSPGRSQAPQWCLDRVLDPADRPPL